MKDNNTDEKENRARKRVKIKTEREIYPTDWLSCSHINNGWPVNK